MFKKIVFLLAGCSAFILAACDPAKEFEKEIKTIDSCLTELDKIEELYNGIQFDSLKYMVTHVLDNEAKMKEYYVADTVDMMLGSYMNSCKGVRKSMSDVDGNKIRFAQEIGALDTQFTNLKQDILNGVLSKEEIDKYLSVEMNDLKVFSISFYSFYDNQKNQSAVFYEASPKIDEYVSKLQIPSEVQQP